MAELRNVIIDICQRAGYAVSDIDVSAISGIVDGFALSNRSSARKMIEALQKAFFFEAVESGNQIKFVPINQSAAATISVNELLPINGGEGTQDQNYFEIGQTDDVTLPRTLSVNYIAKTADYQQGTQEAIRQIADTGEARTESIPVVMGNTRARQVAETLLYMEWTGRITFNFALPIKYIRFEPGDVIDIIDGNFTHSVRILKKRVFGSAIIFEGQATDVATFQQNVDGGEVDVVPSEVLDPGETILHLLDLPQLREGDGNPGFYIAVGRSRTGWGGARVYRSPDDTEYIILSTLPLPTDVGTTQTVLGDGQAQYFDRENTLDVQMTFDAQITSTSQANVFDGLNTALVGNEIIQFQNAELIAERTYRLSRLLRGRLGTEPHMTGHETDERFIMLNPGSNMERIVDGTSLLNVQRYYKGVSVGLNIQDTAAQTFTNTGNALRPWQPSHFRGVRQANGDWFLSWVRRTRANGSWVDNTDVPLGEEREEYTLEIVSGGSVVDTIKIQNITSYTYTTAQQTATLGSTVTTLTARISQNSALLGPGYRTEEIFNG